MKFLKNMIILYRCYLNSKNSSFYKFRNCCLNIVKGGGGALANGQEGRGSGQVCTADKSFDLWKQAGTPLIIWKEWILINFRLLFHFLRINQMRKRISFGPTGLIKKIGGRGHS